MQPAALDDKSACIRCRSAPAMQCSQLMRATDTYTGASVDGIQLQPSWSKHRRSSHGRQISIFSRYHAIALSNELLRNVLATILHCFGNTQQVILEKSNDNYASHSVELLAKYNYIYYILLFNAKYNNWQMHFGKFNIVNWLFHIISFCIE